MVAVSNENSETVKLFNTVVSGGYCIGCGACASINGTPIKMKLDEYGQFCATVEPSTGQLAVAPVQAVCPFSGEAPNEDQIGQELFGKDCTYHNKIGYYLATYAGFVSESNFRAHGSSGGMGTWIVSKLLSEGLVDSVIHVHQRSPSDDDPRLFHYQLSTTVEQVNAGAKSRYYPIEMSEVMQLVRERSGRYAIVGIPCFIKAVRLLMKQDPLLAERLHFCIGLVCGHLKSIQFAQMFAWQCGIEPNKLLAFDFRKKLLDADANRYGIEAVGLQDDQTVRHISPVRELYGADWGLGFFKYKACDYCDDVVAETADIVVGDAWLPQYVKDSQGTNVIIVRHPTLCALIEQGISANQLKLDRIDADEVARSQTSGFNHRRDGLAYRLYLAQQKGEWCPPKRVKPSAKHLNHSERKRQVMRVLLAAQSHIAFKDAINAGNFSLFVRKMNPLIGRYYATYHSPLWRRLAGKVKRFVMRLLGA